MTVACNARPESRPSHVRVWRTVLALLIVRADNGMLDQLTPAGYRSEVQCARNSFGRLFQLRRTCVSPWRSPFSYAAGDCSLTILNPADEAPRVFHGAMLDGD